MTSLLLHKLMYYARILATPLPPYAACILNQWPLKVMHSGKAMLDVHKLRCSSFFPLNPYSINLMSVKLMHDCTLFLTAEVCFQDCQFMTAYKYVNISHILCPSLDSDHPTHSWCTIDRCTGPARFFASYFLVRKRGACLGTLNIYTTDKQKWKKHIFLKYTCIHPKGTNAHITSVQIKQFAIFLANA